MSTRHFGYLGAFALAAALQSGTAQAAPLPAAPPVAGQADTAMLHNVQFWGHHHHHGGWGHHHHGGYGYGYGWRPRRHHHHGGWGYGYPVYYGGWGHHHHHHHGGWGHHHHH